MSQFNSDVLKTNDADNLSSTEKQDKNLAEDVDDGNSKNTNKNSVNSGAGMSGRSRRPRNVVPVMKGVEEVKSFSCRHEGCKLPDNNSMVECDRCKEWYHYKCVGVNRSIMNKSWFCSKCDIRESYDGKRDDDKIVDVQRVDDKIDDGQRDDNKIEDGQKDDDRSRKSASTTSSKRFQNNLRILESEKKLKDQMIAEAMQLKLKRIEEERLAKEEVEKQYLAERAKNNQEFLDKIDELSCSLSSTSQKVATRSRIHNWIQEKPDRSKQRCPIESTPANKNVLKRDNERDKTTSYFRNVSFKPSQQDNGNTFSIPDASHIIARQVLSKIELPKFSGDPLDWPMFYSAFQQTTEQCYYSHTENLLRLQKSLQGDALELVRASLIYGESVPTVIQTLKQMFGQPETILSRLIQRVRALPAIRPDRHDMLVRFSIETKNLYATIIASELNDHLYNPLLRQELVDKLPHDLKLRWGTHRQQHGDGSLSEFNVWLSSVAEAASLATPDMKIFECKIPDIKESKGKSKKVNLKNEHRLALHNTDPNASEEIKLDNSSTCIICKKAHHVVEECSEFLNLTPGKRFDKVKELQLCRTCLKQHASYCNIDKRCGIDGCRRYHNSLLHKSKKPLEPKKTPAETRSVEQHSHQASQSILYRILPVYLYSSKKRIKTYAMFDEGSSSTFLEESVANELELDGPCNQLNIKWTSDISRIEQSKLVNLEVSGICEESPKYRMSYVNTVKKLNLPTQAISCSDLSKYSHLKNICIPTYDECRPTILIGMDHYKLTIPLEIHEGTWEEPVATRSRLGWSICGVNKKNYENQVNIHKIDGNDDHELHANVKEFFTLENFGVSPSKPLLSRDDQRACEIMKNTVKYINGRYETGLLWLKEVDKMPPSKDMALRRLNCFENKLLKNPELKKFVVNKVKEYLEKGYAAKLDDRDSKLSRRVWYLPVFAVQNVNKPSKIRLVWDAAAKSHGVSLNDFLLKGPDELSPLLEVLFRFRQKRIAISGDLREMFHQIVVSESDRHVQRFLWRDCEKEREPDEYVLRVLTFGATCSPSIAQHIKNLHAEKFIDQYPRAVQAIQCNHYVDDWLDSFDTHEEAIQVAKQVRSIYTAAGFEIRNWLCNNRDVMTALKESNDEKLISLSTTKNLNSVEGSVDKVLGMMWCTDRDVLIFRVNHCKVNKELIDGSRIPTKRQALSVVMSTFDPLGVVSPFIVYGKIILQEIWRQGIQWDQAISDDTNMKWQKWVKRLKSIEQLQIPRAYFQTLSMNKDTTVFELHIFIDASEEAYAAVAYVRGFDQNKPEMIECSLLASKTKVAPQKPVSIPRLELLAAVLGVRLMNSIIKAHTIAFKSRIIWSDSSTVLNWLRSDARRYKSFVALRISECLESTEIHEWRYVPSKLNAADEATKWYTKTDGITTTRWLDGPEFLWQDRSLWPADFKSTCSESTELRAHLLTHSKTQSVIKPNIVTIDLHFTDSWNKMVRSQAYFERAIKNFTLKKNLKNRGLLSYREIKRAEISLFKRAQWDYYKDEISTLLLSPDSHIIDATSPLYTYSPYIDEDGLIRMKGRIDKANGLYFEARRPVILPKNHEITFKLVRNYHRMYLHQNHETIINEIRQRFIIPQLRVLYRTVRSKCPECKIKYSKPMQPSMADLPADRLAVNIRPFTNVGIDYFGPLEVVVGRHSEKRWGVIYTCLSIRAIHLEIANSLSTDSCIRSLIRFMARRGTPRRMYSDNGTNFRGTNNALQAELRKLNNEEIANQFTNIEWRFIPPSSPHFGGAWERLVRVVKSNLLAALPERKTNEEILLTCMAEVEMIVNTRPLTHIPIDAEEAEALTPNHFLLGDSGGVKPLCPTDESSLPTTKSWKISQMFADRFWKRFVREYLPDLAKKTKWYVPAKPLKVGDLVFIIDEKNVRGSWPRGIVTEVMCGNDKQVRSAMVKTKDGVYSRPAAKLAIIDVRKDS